MQTLAKRKDQSYEDYLRGLSGSCRVLPVKMADLDDNTDPERLNLLPEPLRTRPPRTESCSGLIRNTVLQCGQRVVSMRAGLPGVSSLHTRRQPARQCRAHRH